MPDRRGRKAVFLDKDGTLVVDVPYNVDPALVVLSPGAPEGLRAMSDAGFALVVATNQSGVARGFFTEEDLAPVERRIRELVRGCGAELEAVYHCPHHPDGCILDLAVQCDCRKPAAGLILRAAAERGLDTNASWLVGDILDDIEAGKAAGCRTVLLDNGNETEWVMTEARTPDHVVADLAEAGRLIASEARREADRGRTGAGSWTANS